MKPQDKVGQRDALAREEGATTEDRAPGAEANPENRSGAEGAPSASSAETATTAPPHPNGGTGDGGTGDGRPGTGETAAGDGGAGDGRPGTGATAAGEGAPGAAEREPAPEDELAAARRQAEETYDKYLRLQAEFENFKKRMHKEKAETLKFAQFPLLRDLIEIMDNFERAVEHARANPGEDHEGLISGIEMVIKQLGDTFEKFGMVRISAVGKVFDPTCHEAMGVVATNDVPENQVMEEFQAGYTLHDRVVRPAMVTVAKPGAASPPDPAGPAGN